MAYSYRMLGQFDLAKEYAARALALSENQPVVLCALAEAHAALTEEPEARAILNRVQERAQTAFVPSISIAGVYMRLNELDTAFEWLKKGIDDKEGISILVLHSHLWMDLLGGDPRYWALIDRMKFPALPMEHSFYDKEQQMRYGRPPASGPTVTDTTEPPSTGLDKNRIVVLPMKVIGREDADLAFSEGLHGELLTQLRKIDALTAYDGNSLTNLQSETLAKRCNELGAGSIFNGTVQQVGAALRVVWGVNDSQIPKLTDEGDTENGTTNDIFALQNKIAKNIAEALSVQLQPSEKLELDQRPTDSTEAYNLYVQGRALWNRRTIPDFEKATNYFHQAIAIDENFAQAYAGLADCHVLWNVYERSGIDENSELAIQYSKRAQDLDPRLSQPHAALGYVLWIFKWDWEGAEKQFQAAMTLDPKAPTAFHWYSDLLMCWPGREAVSVRFAKKALDLDPSVPIHRAHYAAALLYSGQTGPAIDLLRKQMREDPAFLSAQVWLAAAYRTGGMMKEAAALADGRQGEPYLLGGNALALAGAGRTEEAKRVLDRMREAQAQGAEYRCEMAAVHLALGEKEIALELLAEVVAQHGNASLWFYSQPDWKTLQDDPRYQAICRKVRLLK